MGAKGQKRPRDLNRLAVSIVEEATLESADADDSSSAAERQREGGAKGGRARAAKLSHNRRVEIAKRAARARWEQKQ